MRFMAVTAAHVIAATPASTPLPARSELQDVDFGMPPPPLASDDPSLAVAILADLVTLDFLTASRSALGDFFILVFVGAAHTVSEVV